MSGPASLSDHELLGAWLDHRDEAAFAALVRRHQDMVHSACLRRSGNVALAQDAAQATFLLLAQKGAKLRRHASLAGWLYQTAVYQAANLVRKEQHRSIAQSDLASSPAVMRAGEETPLSTEDIAPHLDEALLMLKSEEREAVVQRFFNNRSLRDISTALGTTEDAARKRIARALDRLAALLRRRGVSTASSAGLAMILAHTTQAAPAELAAKVTASVHGTSLVSQATATAALWAKVKVAGTVALLVGIPAGWQWMENRRLERELADARTASAHRDDAPVVPVLMASPEWPELSLARPGALSASIRQAPNPLASTLAALWAVDSRIDTQTRLSLLRTRLGLDAPQTAAVSDALDDMQRDQQTLVRSITEGDVQFENVMQFLRAEDRAEARIRAVLNAEQVAPFTELQEERFEALLGTLVDWRVRDLDALLPLREDQIEGVRAALLQNGREHRGILTAPDVTDFQQLLAKLSAEGRAEAEKLSRLLTPEQMKKYEDQSRSRGAALDRLLQPNHAPK